MKVRLTTYKLKESNVQIGSVLWFGVLNVSMYYRGIKFVPLIFIFFFYKYTKL